MPRIARKISNSQIYHIILRGNDRQDIFYDEQDYNKFLDIIKIYKKKYQYEIYTYCLMTNHVHLVIFDKDNKISKIMQGMEISYSNYFAKKYKKEGHLFKNRFISKNVETEGYLIRLCKYIHQNPLKAGIASTEKYKWSSYNEFIRGEKIINPKVILSILSKNEKEAIENFVILHSYESECINDEVEYEGIEKLTDEQVIEKIRKILKIQNIREIKDYDKKKRNEKLQQLKVIEGTTKVQISRILGINRKIIERAMERRKWG